MAQNALLPAIPPLNHKMTKKVRPDSSDSASERIKRRVIIDQLSDKGETIDSVTDLHKTYTILKNQVAQKKIKLAIIPTLAFGPDKEQSFLLYTNQEGYLKCKENLTADHLFPYLKKFIK